jgi:ABC-type multidrug transport system fused ATPase/permease subunit
MKIWQVVFFGVLFCMQNSLPVSANVFSDWWKSATQQESYLPSVNEEGVSWEDDLQKGGVEMIKADAEKGGGISLLFHLVVKSALNIIRYLAISFALLFLFYHILIIVLNPTEFASKKDSLIRVFVGLGVLSLAPRFMELFSPFLKSGTLSDSSKSFSDFMQIIINYFGLIAGGVATLFIAFAAVKLITNTNSDETRTEAKETIQNSFLALAVILFAKVFIQDGLFARFTAPPGDEKLSSFFQEVMGLVYYIFEFVGIIAFVLMVGAGVKYMLGTDKDEAKKLVTKLAYIFLTIGGAYTLVSFFIPK